MSGLQLADASVWLLTAMTLAVFDITKSAKGNVEIAPEVNASSIGVRYEPDTDYSLSVEGTDLSYFYSHLKSLKCSILPRSAKALELIQQDIQC